MINYKELEKKWQKAWTDARAFEVEPDEREGMIITAAFPYVNVPQHIGHLRTYGTTDTYARYKRMQGFNVLYPMGFHATGTPVLSFAKRIASNDQELIKELKLFNVPDEEIKKMSDPMAIINYFIPETRKGMTLSGYSIDWRRNFVSIEPLYSKMVEWQFMKLKEKGYLTQGKHPVGWCPNDNGAVGQHDTRHDVEPEIEEVTAVEFKEAVGSAIFACATYRPETLYGVTNIFINENISYALVRMNGKEYYLSKEAAELLRFQYVVEIVKEISAKELLQKQATNPINNEVVPILPGYFVKGDVGTGVVMSVPSHAPFDYVALEKLKAQNYPMPAMEYRRIIEIEPIKGVGIGRSITEVQKDKLDMINKEVPALAYLNLLNVDINANESEIERVTKQIYREEAHWGKMIIGDYKGMPEPEARERIKQDMISKGSAFRMFVLSNEEPVYCRCGYRVVVKIVDNQWFINYGNKEWKEMVKSAYKDIVILPEKLRLTFEKLVDWIDLRATERAQGLGTKFPYDPVNIIESLSDSTIYMSFYTFNHILRANNTEPERLKPEFFDYVLKSIGSLDAVAQSTGISTSVIQKCKDSFEYWYKKSSRHSGPDLIPNHLTMYVFNHVAIFDRKFWPKQIVVNGFVNYEGTKMSKSLGNIIPLIDGLAKYGADPLRFVEIAGADLDTETEFSINGISSVVSRNEFLYDIISRLQGMSSGELTHMDFWLYSKLNSKIEQSVEMMEKLDLKNAYTNIYYNSVAELKWYLERGGCNAIVLRDFLEAVTLMIAPIMPHIAEEFWQMLGKGTLAAKEQWPISNAQMVNKTEERTEDIITDTISDLNQGVELTAKIDKNKGKKIKEIRIIVAEDWKLEAYNMLARSKNISSVISDPKFTEMDKETLSKFLSQFSKKLQTLTPMENFSSAEVVKGFSEASDYIGKRFDARIEVESEKGSKSARASRALPEKPAMDIIWE